MKVPRSILSVLNVHRDEWWLVQKLFLFQFFQGAGIAFFFTSAFARFLEHFSISALAYVFVLTSVLLWISGFFYSRLEHHLSSAKLNITVTVFIAGSILLFRISGQLIDKDWFYFFMISWFYVLYLLNNLMFWGLAAQLYDVRQSKRLFGVISAGDIPAKFIGYSVASIIVYYTGTLNLLWVGLLFILSSFPFLFKIIRHEKTEHNHQHDHHKHTAHFHKAVKNYTANILVGRVALLSLIVYACIILINYAFYAEVKYAYKNDVALASFIGFFLATARLLAMLIKIIMTSRLLYWLGNRISLILTPILLIILVIISLLSDMMAYDNRVILYIFGFSAILVDVLNSAINSPVLLTIMQPLSTHERLRAHNIVKGIMDPFGYLFCGGFLLLAYKLNLYSLNLLSYSLIFLALAWIIGIFRVHQQYLKILIHTVSSRFFNQEDFNFYDPSAREMIEKKLLSGTELEVMYILRMLASNKKEESNRLIILALRHPSEKVIVEALRMISDLHLKEAEKDLFELINNDRREKLRGEAIKVLGKIVFSTAIIQPLMHDSNKTVRYAAIHATLNHSPDYNLKKAAEKMVGDLLESPDQEYMSDALDILSETHDHKFDDELIRMLNETGPPLEEKVIKALGIHATDKCLEALMTKLDEKEKSVTEALFNAKERSLHIIKKRLLENEDENRQNESLLNTIGRIGGKGAHHTLYELLHVKPGIRTKVIKVLHRCHFRTTKNQQPFIESLIRDQLADAAAILHMQKTIHNQMDRYGLIFSSLQLELLTLRESLLNLFSFFYDRNKINKIKLAIEINKKETNANAIELVDMTVKREFANPFNAAFEFGDLEYRCSLLKNLLAKDIFLTAEDVIKEILSGKKTVFNNWSKASSLYLLKKYKLLQMEKIAKNYLNSKDKLLRETAEFAVGIH